VTPEKVSVAFGMRALFAFPSRSVRIDSCYLRLSNLSRNILYRECVEGKKTELFRVTINLV